MRFGGVPVSETVRVRGRAASGDTSRSASSRGIWWFAVYYVVVPLSAFVTLAVAGWLAVELTSADAAQWVLGRAAGVTSLILLTGLTLLGMGLSHPALGRARWVNRTTVIRVHIWLAVFTLVFVALHVAVLAIDGKAGVGILGSLLPMQSVYRPVAVTLGVFGLYSGLAAGLTAQLAGRWGGRLWWPIHKVAAVSFILIWFHGILAGSDSPGLVVMYLVLGAGVILMAVSRYTAATPAQRVDRAVQS